MSDAASIVAVFGLVSIGIAIVMGIFAWPAILFYSVLPFPLLVTLLAVHVALLIYVDFYLYLNRKIWVPIRRVLMPLVTAVAKSEAVRKKEPTWHISCRDFPKTTDTLALLAAMSKNARRDLKKKLVIYKKMGITTQTQHSDHFSLTKFVPIIFEHEKRALQGTRKSLVEEFLKRFLIIFVCSDGYSDRYYDSDGHVCALTFFGQQGNVLHALMYFCTDKETQSGIWMYNHFRSILRAVASDSIDYVNFQVNVSYPKMCAGAIPADYDDAELMDKLYLFQNYRELESAIIELKPDLSGLPGSFPGVDHGGRIDKVSSSIFGIPSDAFVSWLLIYAECLMMVLHLWILVGMALPSLEEVAEQDVITKYGYLLSDMMLPILATAFSNPQNVPGILYVFITAHTFLYMDFILDGGRMIQVMHWAYSDWSKRMNLKMTAGAAVLLDTICHTWGFFLLFRGKDIGGKMAAATAGVTVSACVISFLNLGAE